MNAKDENIIENKDRPDLSGYGDEPTLNSVRYNVLLNAIILGSIAGIGMAIYLFILPAIGLGDSYGAPFFKYLILGSLMAYGLVQQKNFLGKNYQFKNGMLLGLNITVVSAIVLIVINLIAYLITDSMAFDKFAKVAETGGNLLLISGIIFFEVLVYGMILTLIILQYLKIRKQPV